MTPRQRRFVNEYLIDLSAKRAVIRAGYAAKSAAQRGSRLLRDPEVRQAVDEALALRSERTAITADRIMIELARVAFASAADYYHWDPRGLTLIDKAALSRERQAAVAEVRQTRIQGGVQVRIKLHDKLAALEMLSRHLGLVPPANRAGHVVDAEYVELSDTERAQRVLAIFERARRAREGEAARDGGND